METTVGGAVYWEMVRFVWEGGGGVEWRGGERGFNFYYGISKISYRKIIIFFNLMIINIFTITMKPQLWGWFIVNVSSVLQIKGCLYRYY